MTSLIYSDAKGQKLVYVPKGSTVQEVDDKIVVIDPSGKRHEFNKGDLIFSEIQNINSWSE